ncbi:thioredoxin reductase (NADPH) [Chitinivorax tropicus]|uniref:Thioredoxin reductase (NADPH) n=1 Tax=Chitinivorax tropicus TaxID=714531 RepID=A0A840MRW5_9PROT|nr:glutaredoxin family protein [Chitinivorax tropicus]MBB5020165.1 thioredoxin reductase (NADPH) [Chitinivorax tropicus]
MNKPVLTVLFRDYCSLCHAMVAALEAYPGRAGFDMQIVDVDADPMLEEKWGEWVPVLLAGDQEICHYHLDTAALDAHLAVFG